MPTCAGKSTSTRRAAAVVEAGKALWSRKFKDGAPSAGASRTAGGAWPHRIRSSIRA
jgi:hypothetical protein